MEREKRGMDDGVMHQSALQKERPHQLPPLANSTCYYNNDSDK